MLPWSSCSLYCRAFLHLCFSPSIPPVSPPQSGKWLGQTTHTQAFSIQQWSPANCCCGLLCREGQCVSAGLWRIMGEGIVCVCRVLGPREVREEKHGIKKPPLCFPASIMEWYHWGEVLSPSRAGSWGGNDKIPPWTSSHNWLSSYPKDLKVFHYLVVSWCFLYKFHESLKWYCHCVELIVVDYVGLHVLANHFALYEQHPTGASVANPCTSRCPTVRGDCEVLPRSLCWQPCV